MVDVPLFSSQRAEDKPLRWLSPREADRMQATGEAVPVWGGKKRRTLVGLALKELDRAVTHSPAAITMREVQAALGGSRRCQRKIEQWAYVGIPAMRHAQ